MPIFKCYFLTTSLGNKLPSFKFKFLQDEVVKKDNLTAQNGLIPASTAPFKALISITQIGQAEVPKWL